MAQSKNLRIGFPGLVAEIPYPATGMGFGNNSDIETTELASGGRHMHSAPTTYKTFNMSWSGKTAGLQPLIDFYNKRYGNRDYYFTDPNIVQGNLLPARWAYSYQIAHLLGGQGQPFVNMDTTVPSVTFNDKDWSTTTTSITILAVPGEAHYLKGWGTQTGAAGIQYRIHNKTTKVWTAWLVYKPQANHTQAPQLVMSAAQAVDHDFIQITPYVPSGTTLVLEGLDLSTNDYRTTPERRPGEGVGAVRFSNTLDGTLTSTRIGRIGLSVELTEVEARRGG